MVAESAPFCRFFAGWGIGWLSMLAPLYQVKAKLPDT